MGSAAISSRMAWMGSSGVRVGIRGLEDLSNAGEGRRPVPAMVCLPGVQFVRIGAEEGVTARLRGGLGLLTSSRSGRGCWSRSLEL